MKTLSRLVVLQVSLAMTFAAVGGAVVVTPGSQTVARETLRVLFIGSSPTRRHAIPEMVERIAASKKESPAIQSTLVFLDGAILRSHLVEGTAVPVIDRQAWDFVVLEEDFYLRRTADRTPPPVATGTTRPVLGVPATYHEAVRELSTRIRARGGRPLLWTRWQFRDYPDLQGDLDRAVIDIGNELNIAVAPVAAAMLQSGNRRGAPELFEPLGRLPSATGSYLGALVIYATMTGVDPRGATSVIPGLVDLDATTARELQETAWSATLRRPGLPAR